MKVNLSHAMVGASTTLGAAASLCEKRQIEWFVLANKVDKVVGALHCTELSEILSVTDAQQLEHRMLSEYCSGVVRTMGASANLDEIAACFEDDSVERVVRMSDTNEVNQVFRRDDVESRILLSVPHMGRKERELVLDAFDSNWVAPLGPHVDAFEAEIAELTGVSSAAALSSGTAALHLALIIEGVQRGDRVYCSDLTFAASVNAIMYQGATPVLIDAAPDSWNMSADALARALKEDAARNQLPKAIIVVNVYGQQADMNKLQPLADQFEIPVIEDAAESLGATYDNRASGSFGKSAVFSFNGNKIITTSGGGMLVSDDSKLVEKARFLSTQAREPVPYYLHEVVGYNYRMSNILAAIGRGQLGVLSDRVKVRRSIYQDYRAALSDSPGVSFMPELENAYNTHWLSTLLLDREGTRATPDGLIEYLNSAGIEARNIWRPMHMQPVFAQCETFAHDEGELLCSSDHYRSGVCLPSASNMTSGQRTRVMEVLRDYMHKSSN